MAHAVFISHSSKNKPAADQVCAALEAAGIPCWIAPRDILPGTEWLEAIMQAIAVSRALVLIATVDAIESPQVERELHWAVNKRIPILPLRIEPAAFSETFQYLVGVHHWFDAWTPPLEQHLLRLAEVVRRVLQEPADRERAAVLDRPAAGPLPTPVSPPHNLPVSPTPIVGRDQELRELIVLLTQPEVRLVTLTGPGGTGKTRLSLQAGADLLDLFVDGVFVAFLAPIREAELVVSAIAEPLGVRAEGHQELLERLKEHLRDRQTLLLLDNFEQVLEAGPLVVDLLESCPRLRVLATSREALHVRGEQEFAVPPLDLPDLRRLPPPEELSRSPAVALFLQRAQAARRDFSLTTENARAVAEICARLDGLPLAIELAAARIKLLPPQAMLGRLENRLKLLMGGARDLPERHQTLRAAIDWSYDLLEEGEKTLFRRLAVFARYWTLEAAEAVCNAAGDLSVDVLDGLGSLVDQSLVRPAAWDEDEPRFWMLQTIREYSLEQLAAAGERDAVERAHAAFCLALAEEAAPKLVGAEQALWLSRLENEHDNCRAALDWSIRAGDAETGLRLGGALWRFWEMRGNLREGLRRLNSVLAMPAPGARPEERARALNAAGALALDMGDYPGAVALLEEGLAIARACGDQDGTAFALNTLGIAALEQGREEEAVRLFEQALAAWRELGDKRNIAKLLNNLGSVATLRGHYEEAVRYFEESLALKREFGDQRGIANSLNNLGELLITHGDYERAAGFLEESLRILRELGDSFGTAKALDNLARLAFEQDDISRAAALHRECLTVIMFNCEACDEVENRQGIAMSLEGLARIAAARERWLQAARLWGAAQAVREAIGSPLPIKDRAAYEGRLAAARAAVGEPDWETAEAEGRRMPVAQAIASAVEEALAAEAGNGGAGLMPVSPAPRVTRPGRASPENQPRGRLPPRS